MSMNADFVSLQPLFQYATVDETPLLSAGSCRYSEDAALEPPLFSRRLVSEVHDHYSTTFQEIVDVKQKVKCIKNGN